VMARITAERLVEHLEQSGYVIMCKPPLGQHGAPGSGILIPGPAPLLRRVPLPLPPRMYRRCRWQ
jgi:hypothetical protein